MSDEPVEIADDLADVTPRVAPYRVKLEVFEGPLDLLLHLIKREEVEIVDISIATITDQYLAYLDLMRDLSLDIAGEFLVMAATLTLIKSRRPPRARATTRTRRIHAPTSCASSSNISASVKPRSSSVNARG